MRKWTKSAGLIFLAAAAACSGSWLAFADEPAKNAGTTASDPFASTPADPAHG